MTGWDPDQYAQFAGARLIGVDSSAPMLARAAHPCVELVEADMATWQPPGPVGLIFSNAALHWLPDMAGALPRLAGLLAPGGVLALQVPASFDLPAHQALFALARHPDYAPRLASLVRDAPVPAPAALHRILSGAGLAAEIWTTTRWHRLTGPGPVLAWMRGTVLRPYLAALGADAPGFEARLGADLNRLFPAAADGSVLFAFRRLFAVARLAG